MSMKGTPNGNGSKFDFDSLDYDLLSAAVENDDMENYIKLRQLYLLKEIRDGISELTTAAYGIG